MPVPAEDLILRPFQEVADRGNDAVANAEACDDDELSAPLAKGGKAVAKEGERALKRLQPVWDAQIEKYGDAFREAMVENEDIDAKRKILDDLLYDFEDYIEPDTFEADKFTELQAATKAFALATIDATKRVKVEAPAPAPPTPAPASAPAPKLSLFPPLPPLPPVHPNRIAAVSQQSPSSPGGRQTIQKRYTAPIVPAESPTSPILVRPNFASGPPPQVHRNRSTSSSATETQRSESSRMSRHSSVRKRPALPTRIPSVSEHPSEEHPRERRPSSPDVLGLEAGRTRMSPASAVPRTTEWVQSHSTASEDRQLRNTQSSQQGTGQEDHVPELTPISKFSTVHAAHNDSSDKSISPSSPASVIFTDSRSSYYSSGTSVYSTQSDKRESTIAKAVTIQPLAPRRIRGQPQDTYKITTLDSTKENPPSLLGQDFEPGLILAAEIKPGQGSDSEATLYGEANCRITAKSTFQVMGGFCSGAELFRRAGSTRGIKQSIGFVANRQAMTGRCVGCGYAHSYDEVKIDADKRPQATLTHHGARFRLRFLYKSHLNITLTPSNTEPHYACLFCIHAGATVLESDATVFTSPDMLLRHLAHHPQPLPTVEGIRVLYGKISLDDPYADDFDLHLPAKQLKVDMGDAAQKGAAGIATRDHMQRFGAKKLKTPPSYNGEVLRFLSGARIVGVSFPERWEGKWCMGWHDGVEGAFPAKAVDIAPPEHGETPAWDGRGGSGVCVRTRWKWLPRVDEDRKPGAAAEMWLSFEKGEVLTDVRPLDGDREGWCWSGRDARGRWGLFPRSHVVMGSMGLENGAGAMGKDIGGAGLLMKGKERSKGLALFGRKRSGSIASTSGSSGRGVSMAL